ncbi:MAG TPA: dipeptide/oligopeptide/nickel ABC transporter ATP-binding protein, partial [Clostridia bacterium]|nr:dipeptide/oligopeptide/nickel ABC transporter ATP-binding protein [Clostridia bacterium]
MAENLIEVHSLKKYFPVGKKFLHAVDEVNLAIPARQTLGLVGESGCGKSTLGRLLLNLIPPSGGEVLFHSENILNYSNHKMRKVRQKMQIIFQDPYASLNPRMTISEVIAEPVVFNKIITDKREVQEHVYKLMDLVGLSRDLELSYPHELDGGRRQRIVIARALSMNPEFIVCDEPVSALDVSIQAQTLNLLMDLQESLGLTYVFITHDLSVVKHISQQIAVMYLGQIIEFASSDT